MLSIIVVNNYYYYDCDIIFYNIGANYFFFLLLGGTIASFNNLVSWGAGSFLSEVWFPVTERATATAIAMAVAPGVSEPIQIALCYVAMRCAS